MNPDPLPCPFCFAKDTLRMNKAWDLTSTAATEYWVTCLGCSTAGPSAGGESTAIYGWNLPPRPEPK